MGWGAGGSCTPRPPIRQQPLSESRVITVVFLGLLLDLLAFTLLLPLLPALLESHGRAHDPLYGSWQRGVDWFATAIRMPAEKRYNSVLFGGLIGSVFSFLQFLLAPVTGAVSDCLGRRPVMLLSLAGLATSYAVWAASKSFAAFLASRVIGGISKGNVSLSTAIVADLGSPSARSRGMAVIGVAFSLAFTLGPMLGAFLPAEMVPWLALLFAASDLLFIFCFLPETLPAEKRASSIGPGFQAAADLLSPVALLRFSAVARGQDPPAGDGIRHLRRLGLVYFLYLFLFSGLEFTLSFLAHQRFQFSSLQQGKMFFFIGLTMATVQGAYARKISPGSEIAAVKRAILLLVPAFLLIGWGLTLPALGLGLLLYSFGPPGGRRPASTSRLPPPLPQRLAQAEGHDHGHTSEPGRPGQGSGTHGGRLSVLAGRGQGLLHGVLRPLPAPFPAPAQPEASSPHGTQGRVVELAPPQAGGGGGEGNGTSRLPLGPSPGPCQTLQQLRGTRLGSPARRAGSRDSPTPFRFCVHFSLRHTVSAKPPNDKIKQLFYTKCLSPAHGCASLPPTWETPEHQKLLHLH
ncbi:major facilitator superfamily domain-containing protein 10 isoform X4 [Panthera pardus]|uniref:Major facilitator superfamily domain-containing protein 10 isoform X4 n=1 Tax=Panthera pardus TaxID=9691 RepID=A0A9W2VGB1_PANPR|nr:major facilitator superfamily domain-containing protein 10 isoform X4 [Panthera pardus]XP_053757731.1 major facilitator superfamily domain-containing protein 10 isoform X4 [Panthera pardus]XP_053757732.1 major facilitator superfamily domain-containing protein 10 isoform X4 [Panthera pardus]